jgi:hypothetical protein
MQSCCLEGISKWLEKLQSNYLYALVLKATFATEASLILATAAQMVVG